jgi:dolichol-phosphate mannosyltransferase
MQICRVCTADPFELQETPAECIMAIQSIQASSTANVQPAIRLAREVSVVIPTLNEAKNLPRLAQRIHQALAGVSYEVIVVDDDSTDDTAAVCGTLGKKYPLQLVVRHRATDGLSGAVLHGMRLSTGRKIVVMDADLQHPPEKIPELLAGLEAGAADFVIGSRYVAGGDTEREWGLLRKVNSRVATWLAKPFAGPTRDPMSGFFALHRDTFESAARLTPVGYKIALELMCKCRVKHVAEVPIHFAVREAGESKLSFRQQLTYMRHLSRLYTFTFPRLSLLGKASAAASAGWMFANQTNPLLASVMSVLSGIAIIYGTRQPGAAITERRAADVHRVFRFAELPPARRAA